jgi:hypothetical protein
VLRRGDSYGGLQPAGFREFGRGDTSEYVGAGRVYPSGYAGW